MEIIDNVRNEIKAHGLIRKGDTVLVGVSGGADSTALLCILRTFQNQMGLKLIAAHFNHNLRPGARGDEAFVKKLAEQLNVKFVTEKWGGQKKSIKNVSEDSAREKRFEFLLRTAKAQRADCVALAHTLDDVAETVLMRVLRGSGLMGLRGILPKRKIQDIWIVRPMLKVCRRSIEDYLKKNKQPFHQDPTNKSEKYFRNKIRLKLLPLLEKNFSPQVRELLAGLADSAEADYDYLESSARKALGREISDAKKYYRLSLATIARQSVSIRRMMFRLTAEKLKGNLNQIAFKHVREVEDLVNNRPVSSLVHWPQGVIFKKEKGFLRVYRQ